MTIFFLVLCLVFGFFSFRHFRNGRLIWGVVSGFGSLLMAGSITVDYLRHTAGADRSAPLAQAAQTPSAPQIRDYDPSATADNPRLHRTAEEANADLPWKRADDPDATGTTE